VLLPIFHQSALVSLYVIRRDGSIRVVVAAAAGLRGRDLLLHRPGGRPARERHREPDVRTAGASNITDMLPVTAFLMFLYLGTDRRPGRAGMLDELLSGTLYGNFALIELGIGVALPA
jgi:hypothetical protein